MSPSINKRDLKVIRNGLASHYFERRVSDRLLAVVDAALKPKKFVVAAKKRVKARKAERQDEWAQIREKVLERSGSPHSRCEACGASHLYALSVDHMFGGSNRKTLQSVFTCWLLCARCHREKTNNNPNPGHWLELFIDHCGVQVRWLRDACLEEEVAEGYAHAADIARARLDSLRVQGRAE